MSYYYHLIINLIIIIEGNKEAYSHSSTFCCFWGNVCLPTVFFYVVLILTYHLCHSCESEFDLITEVFLCHRSQEWSRGSGQKKPPSFSGTTWRRNHSWPSWRRYMKPPTRGTESWQSSWSTRRRKKETSGCMTSWLSLLRRLPMSCRQKEIVNKSYWSSSCPLAQWRQHEMWTGEIGEAYPYLSI